MEKIRVAIAGVGNCASSLVQGVTYYKDAQDGESVPGLMHVRLGGFHVSDLEFVAAFDVDASKVGADLSKAIEGGMNNTIKFADVPELGVTVQRGPSLDGLNKYYHAVIDESPAEPVDVAQALRDARAEVLVSYLPVGSEDAQRYYAQAALEKRHAKRGGEVARERHAKREVPAVVNGGGVRQERDEGLTPQRGNRVDLATAATEGLGGPQGPQ